MTRSVSGRSGLYFSGTTSRDIGSTSGFVSGTDWCKDHLAIREDVFWHFSSASVSLTASFRFPPEELQQGVKRSSDQRPAILAKQAVMQRFCFNCGH